MKLEFSLQIFEKLQYQISFKSVLWELLPGIQVQTLNALLRVANEIWFSKELNLAYGVSLNLNCGNRIIQYIGRGGKVFGLNEGEEGMRETLRLDRWSCTHTKLGAPFKLT